MTRILRSWAAIALLLGLMALALGLAGLHPIETWRPAP